MGMEMTILCALYVQYARAGLPCGHDGDARRKFQKQPLKVTNMGVAPACFDP